MLGATLCRSKRSGDDLVKYDGSDDVALATLEKYGFPPLYNDFANIWLRCWQIMECVV